MFATAVFRRTLFMRWATLMVFRFTATAMLWRATMFRRTPFMRRTTLVVLWFTFLWAIPLFMTVAFSRWTVFRTSFWLSILIVKIIISSHIIFHSFFFEIRPIFTRFLFRIQFCKQLHARCWKYKCQLAYMINNITILIINLRSRL